MDYKNYILIKTSTTFILYDHIYCEYNDEFNKYNIIASTDKTHNVKLLDYDNCKLLFSCTTNNIIEVRIKLSEFDNNVLKLYEK